MKDVKWSRVLWIAIVAALVTRSFLLETFLIDGDSMAPGLRDGNVAFVWKPSFNLRIPFSTYELFRVRRPIRGEVVVFLVPEAGFQTMIKRVIAIEGDRVAVDSTGVSVNGALLPTVSLQGETDLWDETGSSGAYRIRWNHSASDKYGPVEVPKNHFFVLGDNRTNSFDSRLWGPIPYSCLKGSLLFSF